MTLKTFDWKRDADLIMNSELSLTKKKMKKKTKKKAKETKLTWSLTQSFRLKMKRWSDHWVQSYRIDESVKLIWWRSKFSIEGEVLTWSLTQNYHWRRRRKRRNWDSWSIKLSLEDSIECRSTRLMCFYSIHWGLLMLCLVILTSRHEHWESNFEINLALFMKATFSTDRDTKLVRALLTRVMIILRDQFAQLLVWLNNKRRWCNSEEVN